jgi:hypothetical protein
MAAVTMLPNTLMAYIQDGTLDLNTDIVHCTLITLDSEFVASSTGWVTGVAKSVGDLVIPTVDNGHVYYCSVAGNTGASEPSWPKNGTSVSDGGVVWVDAGANIDMTQSVWIEDASIWQASHDYSVDALARPTGPNANGHYYKATVDTGSSGGTEPTWPTGSGATVVDGGITWTEQGVNFAANEVVGSNYTDKGQALANKIVSQSGIIGKFDADDVNWANSTITARFATLWKNGTANGIVNPLILMVLLDDSPADVASIGADFKVIWNSGGILNVMAKYGC